MVVFIIITLGAYILLVILSLLLEKLVRNNIVNRHSGSFFSQSFRSYECFKLLYSIGLRCLYCASTDKCCCCCACCGSLITHSYMFISYTPIYYRIIFFGNLVGDPSSGYKHFISDLRFQHCPSYGCVWIS